MSVIGLFLPQAHVASSSVLIRQPVDSVWSVVRTFDEYDTWWPEVSSVERLPDRDGQEVWTLRQPRIADDNLPFGGTWTYELREQDGGTLVTVTEDGEIYNPFFRVMSKLIFEYHNLHILIEASFREAIVTSHLASRLFCGSSGISGEGRSRQQEGPGIAKVGGHRDTRGVSE